MRVVVPYVAGKLHPQTHAWGRANGAEFHHVGDDREAYFRLLRALWAEGHALMVVEQDIVPAEAAVRSLARCPGRWCGCPYQYGGADVVLSGHLGCTRFSAELIAAHPRLFDETLGAAFVIDRGGRDYEYLSVRVAAALRRAGERFHRHDLDAGHHHEPDDIYQQNAREFVDAVGAMRRHRLEATLARSFGDDAAATRAEALWDEARRLIVFMSSRVTPEQRKAIPQGIQAAIAETVCCGAVDS
ncbi:MAG TPA: hypothetical protein VIO37_12735 [Candidatus Dormibacteraeota bacterium]